MSNIHSDLYLSDILKRFPEAMEVFISNGFEDISKSDALSEISPFIRLKTILKVRNINEKLFMQRLEEKIKSSRKESLLNSEKTEESMNLFALLPCPLKLPLQDAFLQFIQRKSPEEKSLNYLIEGNANNQLSYYSYVEMYEDIGEIPDIVISPGINSFFYKDFVDKFIDKGYFADVADYTPNKALSPVNIKDPGGNYTVLSMNVLVMVVDKLKIGSTRLPETWGDLLEPEFEKRIAIRGKNNFFCETTLLTIFKQYGLEGMRKLGRSVKYGWHPSQMVKAAGSSSEDAPAVSVMPYFYAKTIRHKDKTEIIWPKDGAIASPVTMLVKAEKAKELKPVTDFFTGAEAGQICANANFPSLHPEVENNLLPNASLNFVGWDFIKQNDVGKLIKLLNSEFVKAYTEN